MRRSGHIAWRALVLGTVLGSMPTLGVHAQLGVNATGAAPAPSAMLDISSTTQGLLPPRMTQAQRTAIAAPADGLVVYQTDLSRGFYYYDANLLPAAGWVLLGSSGPVWELGGNANTNTATDFLGTIDNQHLIFATNGVERMRLTNGAYPTGGLLGIGSTTPTEQLDVRGGLQITGSANGNNRGAIRFNGTTNAHEGNVDNTANWYQLENVFDYAPAAQGYYTNPIPACAYGANGGLYPVIDNPSFSNTTLVGTIETPYSRFWEDGRHQYLYLASDFTALNICANTDILGIGFQTSSGGGQTITNCQVSMKNTTATTLPTLDPNGLQVCFQAASFNPVAGWNNHVFNVSNFQWNGNWNVLVEWCEDMNNWTSNLSVNAENTNYAALYGIYCDACGHLFTYGSGTCYFASCPNNTPQATPGVLCTGYGHTGGCSLLTTSSLVTCDGTFQWIGAQTAANRRPLLKLNAQINSVVSVFSNGDYVYSDNAVMIERNTGWATSGVYPNQVFKGPGTLGAEVGVWGGGVLLSDHVFDMYFDGRARPEDSERVRGYQHYPIDEMVNYVEMERHLPTINGRDTWQRTGPFSLDDLNTQLWVTVEEQALYIKELNERMDLLRKQLVRKRLQQLKTEH